MTKQRALDTATLNAAARDYAGQFLLPSQFSRNNPKVATGGRDWVIQNLYNATFKDEFRHLVAGIRAQLGQDAVREFDALAAENFTPRDDEVFAQLLADKLAINPKGERIKGKVGTTIIGMRPGRFRPVEVETRESILRRRAHGLGTDARETAVKSVREQTPIYAGEPEAAGFKSLAEFLASDAGALVMNISAEIGILALDAMLDGLDEGTGAAIIQGRTGSQPADPDAATTGTLLFTLVMSDPAFNAASDQGDGTVRAAAAAITDDTSADATGTVGYCRVSSSNDGATALDDHIDGQAGTSGADFNFNTTSIVSGANVAMSSYTVTLPQGSTAT